MKPEAAEQLVQGALALEISLASSHRRAFDQLAAELKKWAKKINLTAITSDHDIVVKHFLDSLTLLKVVGAMGRLADIGSGAGFPSIPVKIIHPELHVVSIDAVEKKVIFQKHVARLLGIDSFEVVHARGEEPQKSYLGSFDWVVSRAFSDLPTFVSIALPLITAHGRMVAMKGRGGSDEALAASSFLAERGVQIVDLLEFRLPISGDHRTLIVMTRS